MEARVKLRTAKGRLKIEHRIIEGVHELLLELLEANPDIRSIIDIGGQDSKAISLFENGKVKKFEMNDRCAAGTGKFLEIMAKTLGYDIEEFGRQALLAENDLNISSMCTVFAESEVTSLIAKGNNRREIARGLHASVIRRAAGMINRVSSEGDIVFTGGVAKNPSMVAFLAEKLDRRVLIPENPQFIGALGAALLLQESLESDRGSIPVQKSSEH